MRTLSYLAICAVFFTIFIAPSYWILGEWVEDFAARFFLAAQVAVVAFIVLLWLPALVLRRAEQS